MDLNSEILNLFQNQNFDKKDLLLIFLLAHVCTLQDPTPNTFLYNLYKLYKMDIINLPNNLITDNLMHHHILPNDNNIINNVLDTISASTNDIMYNNLINNFILSKYNREFEELSKLGEGGFGKVYLVKNKLDNELYAIKKISYKYKTLNNINLDFIINEVKTIAKLDHPNINRYYTAWLEPTWLYNYIGNNTNIDDDLYTYSSSDLSNESATDNSSNNISESNRLIEYNNTYNIVYYVTLYIQLSYCNNDTLSVYLLNRKSIDIDINYIIFSQILSGINYIHKKNIIHRDLKPSNLFINDNLQIKIGDFGLSKDLSSILDINQTLSTGVGTNMYSSPEQLNNNLYNQKTDMYSLGLILLELFIEYNTELEKIKIFEQAKKNPCILPNDIQDKYPQIYDIITNLLSYDPDLRFDCHYLLSLYIFSNTYLYDLIIKLKE